MNRDDFIKLGVSGGLIAACCYGFKKFNDYINKIVQEKEAKQKEFESAKFDICCEATRKYDIGELTLGNKNLSVEDRSYMYDKLDRIHTRMCQAEDMDILSRKEEEYYSMAKKLSGSKDIQEAYVLYLRQQDEKADKEAHEAAIRRSEREKIKAEHEALKLRLDAESKKTDAVVESIKAIANAGKTDASDVNVTINNSKEEK